MIILTKSERVTLRLSVRQQVRLKVKTNDGLIGAAAVAAASVLWGTTGTAAALAPEVGAAAIGACAMGSGGLLQALLAAGGIRAAKQQLRDEWRLVLFGGLCVFIYPLAFYASMRCAGVTVGTVVSIGASPLMAALVEMVVDRDRVSARWAAGAFIGIAGMVLLALAPGASSAGDSMLLGLFLSLAAALTYALYTWAAGRLMRRGIASRTAMGAVFGIGGLALMPVLLMTGAPFLESWQNASVGLYMALVPMLLGYILFGYGLARVKASTATAISLLEPAVAALLAAAVIGERLSLLGWTGIGLIFVSLAVVMTASASGGKRAK